MNLYLVRHGEALPTGGNISHDADRPLTPQGEHDAAVVGRLLAKVDPAVRVVGSSPLVRARRTAEILAAQFPVPPEVRPWQVLKPGMAMREVLAQVTEHSRDSLILVAHQPDLTDFLSWLVADGVADIAFPPGSAARVVLTTTSLTAAARLHWIVSPALVSLLHPEW